jgi:small-conductance mechanosensitive channel
MEGMKAFLVYLFMCAALMTAQPAHSTAQPDSTRAASGQGAPVVIDSDTLFYISAPILSFSPEDRARAISERLKRATDDYSLNPDSIQVQPTDVGTEISIGDVILLTVTDADAVAARMDQSRLSQVLTSRIRAGIVAARGQRNLKSILMAAFYSLATVLVLILILWGIKRLFALLYGKLRSWRGTRIRTLRIQNLEILSADRATQVLIRVARFVRFALTVVLLYVAASMMLGFFPQTRYVSSYLASRLWALVRPLVMGVVNYIPNLVVVVVLVVAGFYAVKVVRFFFNSVKAGYVTIPGFYVEWADTTYKIARLAVIALFIVLLFPYLPGSQSPAFKGVSIFVGLLFSLGSTSVVANIVAGVILTYMRPFRIDDRVKIADTIGDVVEKTILVTRVRSIKNVLITIPNAMVLSSHIVNYSSSQGSEPLILNTSVTIGYDAPWRKVHDLLTTAALATEHILGEPKPFVYQLALDDFYVKYELNAFTDSPRMMARIYSELHQNIQDGFNEAGVEIMSPHYRSLRDGSEPAIPQSRPGQVSPSRPIRVQVSPQKKDTEGAEGKSSQT